MAEFVLLALWAAQMGLTSLICLAQPERRPRRSGGASRKRRVPNKRSLGNLFGGPEAPLTHQHVHVAPQFVYYPLQVLTYKLYLMWCNYMWHHLPVGKGSGGLKRYRKRFTQKTNWWACKSRLNKAYMERQIHGHAKAGSIQYICGNLESWGPSSVV